MGASGAKPPPPAVPLDVQIAAVRQAENGVLNDPALAAAVATLEDYRAMQPKVLALSATVDALAEKLGLTEKQKDELLTQAEKDAVAALDFARAVKAKPAVEKEWPFRREPMP